jgi:glutaminase
VLEEIAQAAPNWVGRGKVADYIPALARIDPNQFAIAVALPDGQVISAGAASKPFSIQSLSKVFTLNLAMQRVGDDLWSRVNREPSGDAFNSLILLEQESGIPRNPFINAGALVVTDTITEKSVMPIQDILTSMRRLSGNDEIYIDEEVAKSEAETGHINAAAAHFLKARKNLHCNVDDVLAVYFRQCAARMSVVDLARAFAAFAFAGADNPHYAKVLISAENVRRLNALMLTCGLYDGVGNFAMRVGIPCKSGVGGGIAGVVPGRAAVAVWSPELDKQGNSLYGIRALEILAREAGLALF